VKKERNLKWVSLWAKICKNCRLTTQTERKELLKTKTIARGLFFSALILFTVASPFRAQAAGKQPGLPSTTNRRTAKKQLNRRHGTGQKKKNKVILLQFGAKLVWLVPQTPQTLRYRPSDSLRTSKGLCPFVMVDVNKGHNSDFSARYGADKHGPPPALSFFDSNGKHFDHQRYQRTRKKADHHSPRKGARLSEPVVGERSRRSSFHQIFQFSLNTSLSARWETPGEMHQLF